MTEARDWRPTSEAKGAPGVYIDVRSTHTYRWLAYKKDGVRQMKTAGRWQRATDYGWENAPLPDGEFTINKPVQP